MTFTEAAAEVLRQAGKPLHYKEITELAIEKNLLSHVGKSPEVTMGARLAALLKKEDKTNPIVRVKPGVFALRDWDEKKGRRGAKEAAPPEAEFDRASGPRVDRIGGGGGGGGLGFAGAAGEPIQPQPIVSVDGDSSIDITSQRDPLAPPPRPMVRDRAQIMAGGGPTGIEIPLE